MESLCSFNARVSAETHSAEGGSWYITEFYIFYLITIKLYGTSTGTGIKFYVTVDLGRINVKSTNVIGTISECYNIWNEIVLTVTSEIYAPEERGHILSIFE